MQPELGMKLPTFVNKGSTEWQTTLKKEAAKTSPENGAHTTLYDKKEEDLNKVEIATFLTLSEDKRCALSKRMMEMAFVRFSNDVELRNSAKKHKVFCLNLSDQEGEHCSRRLSLPCRKGSR